MKQRHAFTMVELLVVIAVLTVLAAMLLPALQKSIYSARLVSCANNMKQINTGLLAYASDSRRCYPKRGGTRYGLTAFNDRTIFDIRPQMETVSSGNDQLYRCPLAPKRNTNQYNLFFDNKLSKSGSIIGGIGPDIVQRGVNNQILADGTGAFLSQENTWYHVPLGGVLRKVGQTWTYGTGSNVRRFSLLASDVAVHYGGHPGRCRWTNHNKPGTEWYDYSLNMHGNRTYQNYWQTPKDSYLYPEIDAHFADQDGSVKRYHVPAGYGSGWGEDYVGISNNQVPLDFER